MKGNSDVLKRGLEYVLPWVVLGIILVYSYAHFFKVPYGFVWSSPDGIIRRILVYEREPSLHVGDQILKIGALDWGSFQADLSKDLLSVMAPGEKLPITVKRGETIVTVQWTVPGITPQAMRQQFVSEWFLAYIFWIAGTLSLLQLRPRDERWFLMGAFNYITAIWLLVGSSLAYYHTWYSALVLRAAVFMAVPVYLHLHWVMPRPLAKLPSVVVAAVYAGAGLLAVAQWLQLIQPGLYVLAFLLAAGGSLVILLVHAVRQPATRHDLWMLLIAAVLAVGPSMAMAIIVAIRGKYPPMAELATLSLPMLPIAYLYAAHRRQVAGLELRMNRVITIYGFVIIMGAIVVPCLELIAGTRGYTAEQTLLIAALSSLAATSLSLWLYPRFQAFVEHRMLGITVPSAELQQSYAEHITGSTSLSSLAQLLTNEIMPSLLVREFVFLQLEESGARVLLNMGVPDEQIPASAPLRTLQPLVNRQLTPDSVQDQRFNWIRLVLGLRIQDNLLGFWLFGKRDPDDSYLLAEIPVLQSFANQTAVALSNILQSERLRSMYQADINRHEKERLRLAQDLHDSVLSELAGMLMNADVQSLPRNFREGYHRLAERLREIVSDLRPPMLSYGLKPAIEELADDLMERYNDAVEVVVDLQSTGDRYPLEKEQHLFRIVQEACENAARHSGGHHIKITGGATSAGLELSITDDGAGFKMDKANIEMYDLLGQGHFGLAGMFERAQLIDAVIRITSAPGAGTRIEMLWSNKEPAPHPVSPSEASSRARA